MNVTGHLSEGGIEPRQHVLEIGTGTGWTAALLAYLLGPEASVVSVENDPTTAERARANLIAGGYEAQIVTGAVEAGYRQETPFGTVVSTAAVRGLVPRAWLLQLRDGGQLITPWGNDRVSGMILNVQKGYRSGRNNHTRSFGWMTSSPGWPWLGGHHDDTSGWRPSPEQIEEAEVAAIDLRAGDLERILDPNQARLFVGMSLRYGRLVDLRGRPCEPHHVMELIDEHSRSWARVEIAPRNPEEFVVRELGPEPLWPQIAKAYELWQEVDEPSPDDFGFRTGPGLQLIHLRSSDFQWELRQ